MTLTPIRVLIVDDHAVVRSGLAAFLSVMSEFELVGEAGDGAEAVQRCKALQPDVVLMDLMMPVLDGVAATQQIRALTPAPQVIALTSFPENGLVQNALRAGAVGYLMKNVSAAELAAAIRAAHVGRLTLSPEAAQALAQGSLAPADNLTDRERDVLALMVEGLPNQEIAERLVVSVSTVKFHISNILAKLGVENRVAAVSLAMQRKLV